MYPPYLWLIADQGSVQEMRDECVRIYGRLGEGYIIIKKNFKNSFVSTFVSI